MTQIEHGKRGEPVKPRVANDYDPVAARYAEHFRDELMHKPFDMRMLDWFAERVGDRGPICDVGCGPGQVAGYLHGRGASVCGIDLSAAMVHHARVRNPDIEFQQGDMLALTEIADDAFGGIVAFYAIVNLAPTMLAPAFSELRRVLRPDGVLLLSFHVGQEMRHIDELLGVPVDLDFYFLKTENVKDRLRAAGLHVTEAIERDPYPERVEHESRRAYIFATA